MLGSRLYGSVARALDFYPGNPGSNLVRDAGYFQTMHHLLVYEQEMYCITNIQERVYSVKKTHHPNGNLQNYKYGNGYTVWNVLSKCKPFIYRTCYLQYEPLNKKPTICLCENKGADQLRGYYREADQRLCFPYTDSMALLLLKSESSIF